MYLEQLFSEVLREPHTVIAYEVSRRLATLFPGRAVIESADCDFTLMEYARAGLCTLRREEEVHGQVVSVWYEDKGIVEFPANIWYEVEWRDHSLDVVLMSWGGGWTRSWILAETESVARRFFAAVCEWNPEPCDEIFVFDGGYWDGRPGLFQAIRGVELDQIILRGSLKEEIRADLERFFASRSVYESFGVPWKRGLLLTGPPGNGKTHTIKALINALGKPCLYVKSFNSEHWTEQTNIRKIFEGARRSSPCLLVLEDLDSLVTDENRSFFLNELDGFAANVGIATVATTNHPEKLDPAIAERPSRFDRTFHFDLPGPDERLAYLARWAESLPAGLHVSEDGLAKVVDQTDGFSFAYLKELALSSVLALAGAAGTTTLDEMLLAQAIKLRQQMTARRAAEPSEKSE
jgi:hypothetical protein